MDILTPHSTIKVYLPIPVKIVGLWLNIGHEIGFSFTNMAMYLFRDANGMKTSKDYQDWIATRNETILVNEMLYFSHLAYCQLNRKKEKFTKEQIQKGIALASIETKEKIMQCWSNSETFGQSSKKKPQKAKLK